MDQPLRSPTRTKSFNGTTLMIVDDNPDHLQLIKLAAEKCMAGVQIVSVSDGEAALMYLIESGRAGQPLPRLILLDLYMPDRADGIQTLNELKAYFRNTKRPVVPVVMFSYSEDIEDVRTCYEQGANAYIVKSPDYRKWLVYFEQLRTYWLETVTLPPV